MTKNVTRRLLTATVSTGVLASALVFGAQSAQASVGSSIINIASANLNNGPCSTNSAGGSGYYNSCSEAWCADFAKWVWAQDGVNVSGLTAGAGSFAQYGSGLHSTPHVGDAAVFNYNGNGYADHVALVASVNTDGTVSTIGGNQSNRVTWGKITAGGYYGSQKVSGYVTPIGGRDDNPAPAQTTTWKAQVLVNGGGGIYHAIRDSSGNWSGFANIASQAGDIGTVGSIADAGINGETHVVAVGGDGKLYHAIRHADGSWAGFGDVNAQAGALSGAVTKVSAVSVGGDLHVLAVAGGKLFHTARLANGSWMPFADVSTGAGVLGGAVTSAAAASVGGQLQVAAVVDGRVVHTIRDVSGNWSAWGDVYAVAGNVGVASDVAMAGTGTDLQIVVTAADGSKQYHGARLANGSWMALTDLSGSIGSFTATGVSAASVDSELQLTFVTNDNRILHTIRHTSGSWQTAGAIPLTGVYGNHYAASITGTL